MKDKTLNLKEALSKISGIPVDGVNQLWDDVKANRALLDGCDNHDFSKEIKPKVGYSEWQCVNCEGIVTNRDKKWYELGLKHGS